MHPAFPHSVRTWTRRPRAASATAASRGQIHVGSNRRAEIFDFRWNLPRQALGSAYRLDEVKVSSGGPLPRPNASGHVAEHFFAREVRPPLTVSEHRGVRCVM